MIPEFACWCRTTAPRDLRPAGADFRPGAWSRGPIPQSRKHTTAEGNSVGGSLRVALSLSPQAYLRIRRARSGDACTCAPDASRRLRSRILVLVHDDLVLLASGECDAVETVVCDSMAKAAELDVALGVWVGIVVRRTVARR